MSNGTRLGRELYRLLPAVYRARDNSLRGSDGKVSEYGDLAQYLDACGELLDRIEATLDQRLADAFPDNAPEGELSCQAWLLPYFADLLDVRLVSPEAEGRRDEIANAVAWRQGRGTLAVVEAVTEAVGQFEAELHEGWQRLALTPRIGMPMLPATAFGEPADIDPSTAPPSSMARHPGLPAVTVDLRRSSRAVRTDAANPAAKATDFGAGHVYWRLANRSAAPCFPGSFEDGSRRTVDVRDATWRSGHFHPRWLLAFVPPPAGFFHQQGHQPVTTVQWSDREADAFADHVHTEEVVVDGVRTRVYRRLGDMPVTITEPVVLPATGAHEAQAYRFEGLCLMDGIDASGVRIELENCAVSNVTVSGIEPPTVQLHATSALFTNVSADCLARLEYCTVLGTLAAAALQASDCIFAGALEQLAHSPPAVEVASCVRYSRVPAGNGFEPAAYAATCTTAAPVFYSNVFGDRGSGVLHPATPDAICYGAEDGGEMGAYHDQHYCLRWLAVHDKLTDFLPVGQTVTLIPDPRLLCAPPEAADQ